MAKARRRSGRPRKAWDGRPITNAPPGFPLYATSRDARVVTFDVWTYMKHIAAKRLSGPREAEAVAFLDQAFEFFQAADNPQLASRPLLYYYSFLNLTKMAILTHGVQLPAAAKHGISDPRANKRTRLRLEGQTIRVVPRATDHSQVFPELVALLGDQIPEQRDYKIIDLLAQIPGIHRTYCQVTRAKPCFLPIRCFALLRDGAHVWVRLIVSRHDADVRATLRVLRTRQAFQRVFDQVQSEVTDELWFETGVRPGVRRGTDTAIRDLAEIVSEVGVWSILTSKGTRFYLCTMPPRHKLPALASIYAVMFYLGSLTRYKPADFDKIITRRYSWIIAEFLRTQPLQFLYGLASVLGGVQVVRPFAIV